MRKLTLEQIEATAIRYWPQRILDAAAFESADLIGTHSKFIAALVKLPTNPADIRKSLMAIRISFPVFLKHLMLLADLGGESFRLIHQGRKEIFPRASSLSGAFIEVRHRGRQYRVPILEFHKQKRMDSKILGVTPKQLQIESPATELQIDAALIIILGHLSTNPFLRSKLSNCRVHRFIGKRSELNSYLLSRYLSVSRQTSGGESNRRGQLMQAEVKSVLQRHLGSAYRFPKTSKSDIRVTSDWSSREVAIEVLFQETTNSTIERKASEAIQSRRRKNLGVCFVIDGFGALNRKTAVSKMITRSDFTVNASELQLKMLARFIKSYLK